MNKGRRNEITFLKYKKRIQYFTYGTDEYITRDGTSILNPKVADVIKDRGQLCYKTQSVSCSCWECSGYYKYNRAKEKVKIIKELRSYFL